MSLVTMRLSPWRAVRPHPLDSSRPLPEGEVEFRRLCPQTLISTLNFELFTQRSFSTPSAIAPHVRSRPFVGPDLGEFRVRSSGDRYSRFPLTSGGNSPCRRLPRLREPPGP